MSIKSLISIASQRSILEKKLRESISEIKSRDGELLSMFCQENLFQLLLDVPKSVFIREMKILDTSSSSIIFSNISDFNETEKNIAAILKKGKFFLWNELTKNEKDDARRAWKRFRSKEFAFSKGRPSPYRKLIIKFIESIEAVSGSPFSYTYDNYSNDFKGEKLKALMVALDLALPASGSPTASTIRDIHLNRKN